VASEEKAAKRNGNADLSAGNENPDA